MGHNSSRAATTAGTHRPASSSATCAVVGSGTVGKTALCMKRATGDFPEEVYGDVFDRFETAVTTVGGDGDGEGSGGTTCNLTVWDTAGSADYGPLVLKNVYPLSLIHI